MKIKKAAIGILLWAAVLTAVAVPCFRLFEEGDWLFYVVRDPAMKKAWIETGILAVLTAAACLLPGRKLRTAALGVLLLGVSYLHGMLMPVLFGTFYFLLVASGGLIRGIAAVILAAAVLSLFRSCTPAALLAVTAASALLNRKPLRESRDRLTLWFAGESAYPQRFLTGVVFLVVLVQIARANSCLDFDSLWYGVRSCRVLAPGGSIFEDLGLVGMVYTYPKGFEILTLPLSGTSSFTVITGFNLCLFLYGLKETGRTAELLAGEKYRCPAMLLTALVPGIVNMTLSAKPDVITWVLQLVMLRIFFETVRAEEADAYGPLKILAVWLLSLTMKPTALIFSTALFGMMSVYGGIRRWKNGVPERNGQHRGRAQAVSMLVMCALALAAVSIRTYLLTGVPFTSVFTGIFEKLGFSLKYPFAASHLPQNSQAGPAVLTALKRVVKMLLMPDGKDMSHVIIAWGGSLFFVLGAVILAGAAAGWRNRSGLNKKVDITTEKDNPEKAVSAAAYTVFLPFAAVCFVTLAMLYQVDGNYYMTLYSAVVFMAVMAFRRLSADDAVPCGKGLPLALICCFQFLIMTMTNWAGTTGFTEISFGRGWYDHKAYYREVLTASDGTIFDLLASEPSAKLVAFGSHPDCLQFACIAESYNDVTSPWGNVEIVNSAEAFEDYLRFMEADYVYADAAHLREEAWQWSRELLDRMTADGTLYDFVYEGENWLAKVRR